MDVPIISFREYNTFGLTQPVNASSPVTPIAPEYRAPHDQTGGNSKTGKQAQQGEEWVDISDMAKLLARGVSK